MQPIIGTINQPTDWSGLLHVTDVAPEHIATIEQVNREPINQDLLGLLHDPIDVRTEVAAEPLYQAARSSNLSTKTNLSAEDLSRVFV